jgi:branched-chain amino acid transport system substrate-binding protein
MQNKPQNLEAFSMNRPEAEATEGRLASVWHRGWMQALASSKRLSPALRTALLVGVCAISSVCGCGSSSSDGSSNIQLGVLYSFVGDQSSLDMASLQGAQLAVDQINDAGGVLGSQVVFNLADAKSDTTTATQAGESLFGEQALPMVMGLSDTNLALPIAQQAEALNRIFMTSGATGTSLTQVAPQSTFLACFSDPQQAHAGAVFARGQLGLSSALIIFDSTSDYATSLSSSFSADFRRSGGSISGTIAYPGSAVVAGDVAAQVKALNPRSIYLAGQPNEVQSLLSALRGQEITVPILGGDSYDSTQISYLSKDVTSNVYYTTHVLLSETPATPQIDAFNAAFKAQYGDLPSSGFSALGYDAINLLVLAIKQAGSTEPAAVRTALESIKNYPGVTGSISYSPTQHIPKKDVTVVTFQNGTPVLAAIIPG